MSNWFRIGMGRRKMVIIISLLLSCCLLRMTARAAEQVMTTTPTPMPAIPPGDTGIRSQTLDGAWHIVADEDNTGVAKGWCTTAGYPVRQARPIPVPGNITEAYPGYHERILWYSRTFTPEMATTPDMRYYLRFGAVNNICDVWLNGTALGTHEGAESPFEFDVTNLLLPARENRVTVRVANNACSILGNYYDHGGSVQHVTLAAQPTVRITQVFARGEVGGSQSG